MIEIEIEDPRWRRRLPKVRAVVRQAAAAAAGRQGQTPTIAILLASDETLASLNHRFRGEAKETNVLAFPAPSPARALGDIAVAFGVCDREAKEQGKPLCDHLRHLIIHGVLHLMGYDHQSSDEAARMEAIEIDLLDHLGVPDPYAGAARPIDDVHAS